MPPRRRRPAQPETVAAEVLEQILGDVRVHETPLERARALTRYLALLQQVQRQVAVERLQDVAAVRAAAPQLSIRALATELGVTRNVITQVVDERLGRPRRRRPAQGG